MGWHSEQLEDNNIDDFKDKFEQYNIKEWLMTDKNDNIFMENLPYEDDSFDLIFSCHAFEHCENPLKALREMKRVSKKWVIIITPFHCKHQILNADFDHIFCLTEIQMKRLFRYTGIIEDKIYVQDIMGAKEQDYNLISIGKGDY